MLSLEPTLGHDSRDNIHTRNSTKLALIIIRPSISNYKSLDFLGTLNLLEFNPTRARRWGRTGGKGW